MLKKVEAAEFKNTIPSGICCDTSYLAITASNAGLKPVFYIYLIAEEATIGFALFEKGTKIVTPAQLLFYSGIWIKAKFRNNEFNTHFFESIVQLKKLYSSIDLVIGPEILDLRPFLWNNFDVKLRYTYSKKTDDKKYSEGIVKHYKRALNKFGLQHSICLFHQIDWKGYGVMFKMLKYNSAQIINIKNWLIDLEKNNFLFCIAIINTKKECVGSGIVLLDNALKKAYFIFMDIDKTEHRSETNAYIYIEIQKWLFDNDYTEFDYIGANTNTIAVFKSRFQPNLNPYYVVSYKSCTFKIIDFFKMIIKKILNH